jgi:hypothetical protein
MNGIALASQRRLRRLFCIAAKPGFVGPDLTPQALKAPFNSKLLAIPWNNLK